MVRGITSILVCAGFSMPAAAQTALPKEGPVPGGRTMAGAWLAFRRSARDRGASRVVASIAFATAFIAVSSMGLAQASPEATRDGARVAGTSGEIGCARHGHSWGPHTTAPAGSHRSYAPSKDWSVAADIPVWKTITLGTRGSAIALRRALHAARCGIGDQAAEVLDGRAFRVATTRTEVDLVVLSVAELGLGAQGAPLAKIYARAAQLGLQLCPVEVAPELRLQYLDQPLGEFLHITMAPVVIRRGELVDLSVGNGGAGLIRIGGSAEPGFTMPAGARFVFVRPR